MKIRVLPRSFFEEIAGTRAERFLLDEWKVISILSHNGYDSASPFSAVAQSSPNLLTLTFDDVATLPNPPEPEVRLFTHQMADEILRFVDDGAMPLIVHCTGGVSRSGAVGKVLDHWFNQVVGDKSLDHAYFRRMNPAIMPNPMVERIFAEVFESL